MAKRRPDDEAYISHGDLKIPVSIYFEKRRNTRISIGADSIHLRLPQGLEKKEFADQMIWAQKWLHKRFEKAPNLIERFRTVQFKNGDRILIMRDTFVLNLDETDQKTSSASLTKNDISLSLNSGLPPVERHKAIQVLIHKLLCKQYLNFMKLRVQELNERYLQQPYGKVVLKYIHSKWGSCSAQGDIVLSSKLLLCPAWVRDYVIVHELAHLVELNHSQDFWDIVKSAIPDYDKAEKWLNNEGTAVEIRPMRPLKLHNIIDVNIPQVNKRASEEKIEKGKEVDGKEKPIVNEIEAPAIQLDKNKTEVKSVVEQVHDNLATGESKSGSGEAILMTLFHLPDYESAAVKTTKKKSRRKSTKKTAEGSRIKNEQLSLF